MTVIKPTFDIVEYFFFLFLNSLSIFMVELDMIEILCC